MSVGYYLARDILGLVLLASGAAKAVDIDRSAMALIQLGIRSGDSARLLIRALTTIELALGVAIFSGAWLFPVDILVFFLLIVFLLVTVYATKIASDLRCRCFGALSRATLGSHSVVRNVVLVAVGVAVVARHFESSERMSISRWNGLAAAVAVAFAIGCASAASALDRVAEARG